MAIASDPALHEEAKRVWRPLLDFATAPAGEEGVMRVVAKRFAIYPQPDRSPAEWGAWWDAYIDALGDLPEASLELGLQAYVRGPDAEFLPKPGRIRELAKAARTPAAIAAERCARAAAYTPRPETAWPAPAQRQHQPPTAEERERVRRMAVDLAGQLKRVPPPAPAIKFRAPVDERGITAEMRELMARQRP